MVNLILFCLASIGMTNIIVDSRLLESFREWVKGLVSEKVYEAFECHQCMGTWCGMVCGLILISYNPIIILLCGCAGSFLASYAYLFMEMLLSKTDMEIPQYETPN